MRQNMVFSTLSVIGIEGVIDADAHRFPTMKCIDYNIFLQRDATQSAILPRQVVCPSVRPSVTLRYRVI